MAGKSPIILLSILLLSFNLFAQTADEAGLCDNGIDDDQDGFVDCFDSDCNLDPGQCSDFFFGNKLACNSVTENPTFSLRLQWASANQTALNAATPAIGDLDHDGIPEVVVTNRESQELYVLDGQSGITEQSVNVGFDVNRTVTIGQVDDVDTECAWIFVQSYIGREIKAYDCNLNEMWSVLGSNEWSPGLLGLADFNEDGVAELYYNNEIRDAKSGSLIASGGGAWITDSSEGSGAADILPDEACPNCSGLELVDGSKVWSVDITGTSSGSVNVERDMDSVLFVDLKALLTLRLPASERKFKHKRRRLNSPHQSTYVSLADYNQDGHVDVITSGALGDSHTDVPITIFFWDVINKGVDFYQDLSANTVFQNGAGRINIGDTDGDGKLNATYVSDQILYSLDENLDPIWKLDIEEGSSGFTGCTLFDFDGDGAAETVYRDERELHIIDGATGSIRNSIVCVSRTFEDYPVVADVDGDGASEICVTCSFDDNQPFNPFANSVNGHVRIFESDGEQWLPSRSVWNQHGYFNTHINDDLTIPREQQSHTRVFPQSNCNLDDNIQPLNGFLNQLPILDSDGCPIAVFPDFGLVDLSIMIDPPTCPENEFQVSFDVLNKGDIPITGLLPVSFYDGDPTLPGSAYLTTDFFQITNLTVGDVATVNTTAEGTGVDFELFVSVNDLGGIPPVTNFVGNIPECNPGADVESAIVDVGPFPIFAEKLSDDERCLDTAPENGSMRAFFDGMLPASETVIWEETFDDPSNAQGDIVDNGETAWNRAVAGSTDKAEILRLNTNNVFWFRDTDAEAVWMSEVINIDNFDFADLSIKFLSSSDLNSIDYLRAFYSVDGGAETLFTNGDNSGSFFFNNQLKATVSGATVQIIVRSRITSDNGQHYFDNVSVSGGVNAQTGEISKGFTFQWYLNGDFSTPVYEGSTYPTASAGVYSVIGTNDVSGCTSDVQTDVITIDQVPDAPEVRIVEVVDNTDCQTPNGLLRAAVIENGMEVTTGFDFAWRDANVITQVISVGATVGTLPGGAYAVIALNQSTGCQSDPVTETVGAPTSSVTLTAQVDQHVLDCMDPTNGIVSAIATGALSSAPAAFTFNWYVGEFTTSLPDYNGATVTGLAPGKYTVEAQETGTGCVSASQTIEVLNNAGLPMITTVPVDNVGCVTGTGEIETTITNSVPGDTYSIEIFSGTQTTTGSIVLFDDIVAGPSSIVEEHVGLLNGFYTVEVINKTQNCRSTGLVEVGGMPGTLVVDNTTPGNIGENARTSCGIFNGSIVVNPAAVAGIQGTLTYKIWTGTSSTPSGTPFATNNTGDFQGLNDGDYTLVVENSFGCASADIPLNIPLMRDEPAITELQLMGDFSCGSNPFNPTGLILIEIASVILPENLGYNLQLYSGTDQTAPVGPVVPIVPPSPPGSDPITGEFDALTDGVYNIVITNNENGCDTTHPFTIADLSVTPVFSMANLVEIQNTSCGAANGFLSVRMDDGSPSGTTDGFNFSWYEGAVVGVNRIPMDADGDNDEATQGNLSGGEYTVLVIDLSTGCAASLVLDIIDAPINPMVTITQDMEDTSCDPAASTGQLSATVDGVTNYDFEWYSGTNTMVAPVFSEAAVATSTFGRLAGGQIYTAVASATGCRGSDSEMVVDNAVRPMISLADVTVQDNGGCTNPTGQITLDQVTFGTDPPIPISALDPVILTIAWYDGNMVQVSPDFSGNPYTGNPAGNGLATGDYTLRVTYGSCVSNALVVPVADAVIPITATFNQTPNTVCVTDPNAADPNIPDTFNGGLTVTPDGIFGTSADYSYQWYLGLNTSVSNAIAGGTLPMGVNAPVGAISADNALQNAPDGDYTVVLTGIVPGHPYEGCTITLDRSIVANKMDPVIGTGVGDITIVPNSHCETSDSYPGGSIELLNVGASTYAFEWYHGASVNAANLLVDGATIFAQKGESIPPLPPSGIIPTVAGATTHNISSLNAGSYTVRSIDTATGCVSGEEIIVITSPPPTAPTITAVVLQDDFSCDISTPTGQLRAEATTDGYAGTYTFNWYTGGSATGIPFETDLAVADAAQINLAAGAYTVEIINDGTKCSSTVLLNIKRSIPVIDPGVSPIAPQRVCHPADGLARSTPSFMPSNGVITGFTPGYTYQWYNGQTTKMVADFTGVGTLHDYPELQAGFYTVVVTETSSGCTSNPVQIEIDDEVSALAPAIDFSMLTAAAFCDSNGGAVNVTVTSPGASPNLFDILWYEGSQDYANDPALFANNLSDGSVLSGQAGKVSFAPGSVSGAFTVGDNIEGSTSNARGTIAAIDLYDPVSDQSGGATLSLVPGTLMGAFTDTEAVSVNGLGVIGATNIMYTPPVNATIATGPAGANITSTLSAVSAGLFTVVAIDQTTGCRYQNVIDIPFVNQQTTTTLEITHVEQCPGNNGTATVGIEDSGTPGYTTNDPLAKDDITQYQIYLYAGNGVPADPFTTYDFRGVSYPVIKDGSSDSNNPGMAGSTVMFSGLPAGVYTALAREKSVNSFNSASRCFSTAETDEIEQRAFLPIVNNTTKVDNTACVDDGVPYTFDGNGSIEVNASKDFFDRAQPGDFRFNWFDGNGAQITDPGPNIVTGVTMSTISNLDSGTYTIEVRRLGQPLPKISYTGPGGFGIGETITIDGTVTAQVDADNIAGDTLTVSYLSGAITAGQMITAPSSGATATVDAFIPGGGTPIEQMGCTITTRSFIIQNVPDIHTITTAAVTHLDNCSPDFNGAIEIDEITVNGTTVITDLAGYNFTWTQVSVTDPGVTFDVATDGNFTSVNNGNFDRVDNLPAGEYDVSATSTGATSTGCVTATRRFTILDQSVDPGISLTVGKEDTSCEVNGDVGNGQIDFTITNNNRAADGDFTYTWYKGTAVGTPVNGAGIATITATETIGAGGTFTGTLTGIDGGDYTIEVINTTSPSPNSNCAITATIAVVEDPVDLSIEDTDYTTVMSTHCSDAITLADGTPVTFVDQDGAIQINMIRENGQAPIAVNSGYEFDWALTDGTMLPSLLPSGATIGVVSDINTVGDRIDQLPAGTYRVMITHNSCVSILADITVPGQATDPALAFVVNPNTNCGTVFNGTLQVTATTGTDAFSPGRYQFEWFDGINSTFPSLAGTPGADDNINYIDSLDTKDYTVRVTDQFTGCAVEVTRFVNEVIENPQLSIPQTNITADQSCDAVDPTMVNPFKGAVVINDNDITLNGVGQAVGLYTFEWFSDQNMAMRLENVAGVIDFVATGTGTPVTSGSINNLQEGTYYVVATRMVTDCPTAQVTINVPGSKTGPVLDFAATPNSVCTPLNSGEGNGTIQVNVVDPNDPTPVLTYLWTAIAGPESTTSTLTNRDDATYEVTVTNTNTGCSTTKSFAIPENEISPRVDIVDPVHITTCNGAWSATIPADGIFYDGDNNGVSDDSDPADYSVEWFDSTMTSIGTGPSINSTGAGNYFVQVTGRGQLTNNDCPSGLFPFEIFGEPGDIIFPSIQLTVVSTDTDCIAGSGEGQIDLTITSVDPTDMITVNWYAGPNATGIPFVTQGPVVQGSLAAATLSQDKLDAGTYTVEIFNTTTGCTIEQSIELDDTHIDPVITDMEVRSQNDCITGGSAEVLALNSGNLVDYTYFLFDDITQLTAPNFNPIQPGGLPAFDLLNAGTYYVIAQENSTGCRASLPAQIDVIDSSFFRSPIEITQTTASKQTNCDPAMPNGSISVAANGMADINLFTYTWRDDNGVVIEADNPVIGGLAAGSYTVEITEFATGCSNTRAFTVVDDETPLLLRHSVSANTHCESSRFGISPSGRLSASFILLPDSKNQNDYDYFWFRGESVPDNLADFLTDSNLLATEQFVDSLASGFYTAIAVEKTDNFCASAPVTVFLPDEPVAPPVQLVQIAPVTNCDPLKPDGEASVSSPGNDIAFYNFDWYVGTDIATTQPFFSGQGAIVADSLSALTYTVVITDLVKGCENIAEITIEDATESVPLPEVVSITHTINCVVPNGAATVTIDGDTDDFRFEWFAEDDLVNPLFTGTSGFGLEVRTYLVIAERLSSGCRSESFSIEILDESAPPFFTVSTRPSVCSLDNGGASLSFDKVVSIDSMVWDLGNGDLRFGSSLNNATDGTGYRVFVRDENQCEFEATFNITTDIIVYNGVSDNSDGMNDWLVIDCIDRFVSPNVKIFNRSGQLVWETDKNGYINGDDASSFRGIANKGVSFGSERLPEGTYFYIIDKDKFFGGDDIVQGFLELVR